MHMHTHRHIHTHMQAYAQAHTHTKMKQNVEQNCLLEDLPPCEIHTRFLIPYKFLLIIMDKIGASFVLGIPRKVFIPSGYLETVVKEFLPSFIQSKMK